MIVIKGTDRIKGVLDLSDVGLQLKTGDTFSLSEDQFHKHGVQVAVKMGLVTYSHNQVPNPDAETIVQLKNIFNKPITVNAIDSDVRPGQTFGLSEDLVNNADIQGALAKGMLEIVSTIHPESDCTETDLEVGGLFREETPGPVPPMQKEISIPRGLDVSDDLSDHSFETNEELSVPNVIDVPNPDPVRKTDIHDPKGKTVVWNPNRDPIPHTRNQMDSVDARTGEISDHSPIPEADLNVSDEISFVDENLDSERKASHPILKDQPEKSDDGLDFV